MKRTHLTVLLTMLLACSLVVGCSRTDSSPPTQSSPAQSTTTQTVTATKTALPQPAPAVTPAVENCQQTLAGWTIAGPKGTGEAMAPPSARVVAIRVGQHTCFDQVTIDIATSAPIGSHVVYTSQPRQDGSGLPPNPPLAGNAVLQTAVFAPSEQLVQSGAPYQYDPAFFAGWQALSEVRYGTSFEGQTSLFIGVASERPFRLRQWQDGNVRKVIIQIAHQQ